MNPERIEDEFPAPSYRGNQRDALARIREAFEAGNDAVLVRAPTGSGKSLLARAICGCARRADDAEPKEFTGAYYTTPQVSQIEEVAADALLSDLSIVRGKGNYRCILPNERDTPVNQAPCVRERGYDCAVKHRCPYFSDRAIASNRHVAATTLAYFMHTAGSDAFGKRDIVVIDEAHGLAEWAEMYATIDLSPRTVPFWDDLLVPEVDGLDRLIGFVDALRQRCVRHKDDLLARESLSPDEAAERDSLQELISELGWFTEDYRDPESPTTWVFDQPGGEGGTISIKPMNPERYLKHTVWERGNRFALLSATILDKDAFCRSVGLDPERVALVDVEHTFPVENRPLYDVACGKMTYEHREETLPKIARTLVRIMQRHPDEKGLVHAHSYAIAGRLADLLTDFGVRSRVRVHDREDRDDALEAWKASDRPDVFLSVKMEEALDLEGDLARWQLLCKAPYPNVSDSRVAHRLEEGDWAWYRRTALKTVIQACGRVVRAPDDYGATYVADSSLLDLFERTRWTMPAWFGEQVDRMEVPDLPAFDPRAAVSEEGGAGFDESSRRSREERSGSGASSAGFSGGNRSPSKSAEANAQGKDPTSSNRRHPLADVWDTE